MKIVLTEQQILKLIEEAMDSIPWDTFDDIISLKEISVEDVEEYLLNRLCDKSETSDDSSTDDETSNKVNKEKGKRDKNEPYVHNKNIKRNLDGEGRLDINRFIKDITTIPDPLIGINARSGKMELTDTDDEIFFDISIPALRGLAYSKKENKFYVINTCPGAGACIKICYALKGSYVQFNFVSLKQTRMLNFLLNHPNKFEDLLVSEIIKLIVLNDDKKVSLRWNNAGDFFSRRFYEVALNATRRVRKLGYELGSFGYTKMADYLNNDEITMNFSLQANKRETDKIKGRKDIKIGAIIGEKIFSDFLVLNKNKKPMKDEKGRYIFKEPSELNKELLRKRIANEYDVPVESVLYYEEYIKLKVRGEKHQYNVIVMGGDGDITASRLDVRYTFNLQH